MGVDTGKHSLYKFRRGQLLFSNPRSQPLDWQTLDFMAGHDCESRYTVMGSNTTTGCSSVRSSSRSFLIS